jgi:hypothetical protein
MVTAETTRKTTTTSDRNHGRGHQQAAEKARHTGESGNCSLPCPRPLFPTQPTASIHGLVPPAIHGGHTGMTKFDVAVGFQQPAEQQYIYEA